MSAVQTQPLATIADYDTGPATSALVRATNNYTAAEKNTYLRRASGVVLSAYAKRYHRDPGSSFALAKWGDLTIGFVVSIARFEMISDRGYDSKSTTDATIKARYDATIEHLNEIADITNRNAREDPDVIGSIDADEEGPLMVSEGGALDEADAWAHPARFPGSSVLQ